MNIPQAIEYDDAGSDVKAVYDDMRAVRQTDYINNIWKYLANDPALLKRTWESVKEVMAPDGALDPLTKELLYLAVSISNNCEYCIATHSSAAEAKGMTSDMFGELMGIVGMANETNRLVAGYRVPVDDKYARNDS